MSWSAGDPVLRPLLFQLNRYIWRDVYGPWPADKNCNGVWDIKEPLIHSKYGAKYLCELLSLVRDRRKHHPGWASTRRLPELEALVVAHNGGPGRLATYPDIAPVHQGRTAAHEAMGRP